MIDTSRSSETETPKSEFLGLMFDDLDVPAAAAVLERVSKSAKWHYLVTPNAVNLSRWDSGDPILNELYGKADFCFLDSRVIALVARIVGLRAPSVITGADLVEHLFAHSITSATRICIVGGGDDVTARLRDRFQIGAVCHVNPSYGFWRHEEEVEATAAFIAASQADYTLLAVGSPGQEMLAGRLAGMPGARGVAICAGASIDFITGVQQRAPRFLRRMALEWAYRLCREPRRLARRYLIESPRGVLLVLRAGLRSRHMNRKGLRWLYAPGRRCV